MGSILPGEERESRRHWKRFHLGESEYMLTRKGTSGRESSISKEAERSERVYCIRCERIWQGSRAGGWGRGEVGNARLHGDLRAGLKSLHSTLLAQGSPEGL